MDTPSRRRAGVDRCQAYVVQPAVADPAETARRLRQIADIALAAAHRAKTAAVSPAVTPGSTADAAVSQPLPRPAVEETDRREMNTGER